MFSVKHGGLRLDNQKFGAWAYPDSELLVIYKSSLNVAYSITSLSALWANQVAHWCYMGRVTGERQAAEFPAALDGREHGVMVIGHVRGTRRVVRVRDGQGDYMTTAIVRWRIAAAARVAKSKRT